MHALNFSPKRAWPSSATVAFSTAVAQLQPLSAHGGDAFVDKGIVYLQSDVDADVQSFMDGVPPAANQYSWLVNSDANGDADLSAVFEVCYCACDECASMINC